MNERGGFKAANGFLIAAGICFGGYLVAPFLGVISLFQYFLKIVKTLWDAIMDILNSLLLVIASVLMVAVVGGLTWCWVNRKRLRYLKL
ncbi:MAG: hypothetical protein WBP44_10090 [Gammaproteobacteria bacterium]